MSLVDDELERHVSERLAGLDEMTFQRRTASRHRRPDVRPLLIAAGYLAAIAAVVGLVATRRESTPAGRITTTPAPRIDPVEHLPALQPGALRGVVQGTSGICALGAIDLATVQQAKPLPNLCVRPGSGRGTKLPVDPAARAIPVLDLTGRPVETVTLPAGLTLVDVTRDGIVACGRVAPGTDALYGILRRFGGGDVRLPSCPVAPDLIGGGLVFLTADRRDAVDQSGRLLARADQPIADGTQVLVITDHLVAVGADLYRDGRLAASFDEPLGLIISASADGRVALVSDGTFTHLSVYRDGVRRTIDTRIATSGGAVAPDGRHLLLAHGPKVLVELDVATLRPVARLDVTSDPDQPGLLDVWSWR